VPPDAPALPARRALAPRYWAGHLLVLAAVVTCLLLGRWQLDVWHDHRSDNAAAVTHEDPVPLDDALGADAAFPASGVGRPVIVTGRWDGAHTVYVAHRDRNDRTGYWAVTPVVTDTGSAILVVRGWTPSPDRAPAAPEGRASLEGNLQPSEDTGLTDSDTHDDVIPELSVTDLLPRAPYDLYGGYVVATEPSPESAGLRVATVEHLPGADATSGLRNLLYALQWWVFGAFAIFMWWRWVQEEILGRRPSPRPR
jgi:surfeit locus 1 family protein